jgi:phospholipase C
MNMNRRKFLSMAARAGTAAMALVSVPACIQRASSMPAAVETGTIADVKHIVILMQENRGFDHYFGTMKGVRGFGDRFPIPLESGKPVWYQKSATGEIAPFHLDPTLFNAFLAPSTPHDFADSQAAWNQGKFGYWPKYKNNNSMGYYRREDILFQFALAEAFTICDAYHCSLTTGTDPNRIIFWSGSNSNPELRVRGINCTDRDAEVNNLRCWIGNPSVDKWPVPGYTYQGTSFKWPTIPDILQKNGITWRIYQDPNDNWTGAMNGCLAFESFRTAKPGSPIYENGMSHWTLADLATDVQNGTLPQVCWVLPPRSFSEHPAASSSPQKGSSFTEQVLNSLTGNVDVWSKTAFFLTFDENDGFFDHVPPPAVPSYNLDGSLAGGSTINLEGEYFSDPEKKYQAVDDTITSNIRPFGLGARVPMYVISPWSKGGWVASEVFDHTSMAMFLEKRFQITVPNISPWHRAICGDLTSAFDFASPNFASSPQLPSAGAYLASDAQQRTKPEYNVPTQHQPLYQEAGSRLSRKLPYELHVHSAVKAGLEVVLTFDNTGTKGVVYHVYDKLHLERIPRRYCVEAGKFLKDVWTTSTDGGKYDLWVYGPNGFVRAFRGATRSMQNGTSPEIRIAYDVANCRLSVNFHNDGIAACTLTVKDNVYGNGGPWNISLAPGENSSQNWTVKQSGNWYDFSVTDDSTDGYERRFAGRIETGQHGISDPAMGTS